MDIIKETEKNFANFIGVKHAIMVNSGTAALHSAYLASGLETGKKVIVPAFTFPSTVNMLLATGAIPVFVDIEPDSYLINIKEVLEKINDDITGIVIVNLFGKELSEHKIYKLKITGKSLIVDSAQCIKPNVNYGDIQCFSFHKSKNFSCFEGGAVTTNNDKLNKQIRTIISQGEDGKYNTVRLGYNYRMSDLQAVMINHQFMYHYIGGHAELGRFGPIDGHYPRTVYQQPLYVKKGFYHTYKGVCPIAEKLASKVFQKNREKFSHFLK